MATGLRELTSVSTEAQHGQAKEKLSSLRNPITHRNPLDQGSANVFWEIVLQPPEWSQGLCLSYSALLGARVPGSGRRPFSQGRADGSVLGGCSLE